MLIIQIKVTLVYTRLKKNFERILYIHSILDLNALLFCAFNTRHFKIIYFFNFVFTIFNCILQFNIPVNIECHSYIIIIVSSKWTWMFYFVCKLLYVVIVYISLYTYLTYIFVLGCIYKIFPNSTFNKSKTWYTLPFMIQLTWIFLTQFPTTLYYSFIVTLEWTYLFLFTFVHIFCVRES